MLQAIFEALGRTIVFPRRLRAASRFRVSRVAVVLGVFALGAPASALAGRTVRSGNETVRVAITAKAQPGAARSSHGAKLRYVVNLGTVNGQRSTENIKDITVRGPRGLLYNTSVLPRCVESKFFNVMGYKCPARSLLGVGTAKADARPTLATLIDARLTAYNSSNDLDAANKPRTAKPGVVLNADIGGGNSVGLSLDVSSGGTLLYQGTPPAPGQAQSLYSIVALDLTVGGLGSRGRPYIQLPATCPRNGLWRFTLTERFRSGRAITATHDLRCGRAH
jgi:hypothetical protein